ncbi:putative holin-like toxin [Lacrimispora sp.]
MNTYEEFMVIINIAALIVAIFTYVKHNNKGTKK